MKVGIVNVTGYAGVELARILQSHPEAEITQVTGRSAAGQRLSDIFPHLKGPDLTIVADIEEPVDFAFLALPHGEGAARTPKLLESGAKVIDISADFRLKDVAVYEKWYVPHPAPQLLPEAVYGLPELRREEIRKARLIANPGCYPTSVILALAPVADIVEPNVIVDSKSGVSGAGRTLSLSSHYSEVNESVTAYSFKGHRHLPEMAQEINAARERVLGNGKGSEISLLFLPHLIPMTRGILSDCYARLTVPMDRTELLNRYREFYRNEPFIRIVEQPPQTKHTWGSNYCMICPFIDERTNTLVILSCLDNLVKGAAGQAVQNMNLMAGIAETTGIDNTPLYP